VINIILRKDYRGAEISVNHWQKLDQFADRNYESNQVSGSIGFGDLGKDRYNVVVAAEWFKREPVWVRDGGSGIQNDNYARLSGRNTPTPSRAIRRTCGASLRPAAGSSLPAARCRSTRAARRATRHHCRHRRAPGVPMESFRLIASPVGARAQRRHRAGTYQISSMLSAFVEAGFTRNEAVFTANPPALDAAAPSTWFNRDGQRFSYTLILPIGHPDNPTISASACAIALPTLEPRRRTSIPIRRALWRTERTFGAWDWESAVVFNKTSATKPPTASSTSRAAGGRQQRHLPLLRHQRSGAARRAAPVLHDERRLEAHLLGPPGIARAVADQERPVASPRAWSSARKRWISSPTREPSRGTSLGWRLAPFTASETCRRSSQSCRSDLQQRGDPVRDTL